MKYGMQTLSPYQVAAIRILSAGIVLIPFAYKAWRVDTEEFIRKSFYVCLSSEVLFLHFFFVLQKQGSPVHLPEY
jgi:hypothetical protein